jgi:hypothetical protein
MTEDPEIRGADETGPEAGDEAAPVERVRTGVDGVDAVITAVEDLEERPIEEHVGVFEQAHEQLRRALDGQPADPA